MLQTLIWHGRQAASHRLNTYSSFGISPRSDRRLCALFVGRGKRATDTGGDTLRDKRRSKQDDLWSGQEFTGRGEWHTLFRHTVDAAQIALFCEGYADVVIEEGDGGDGR